MYLKEGAKLSIKGGGTLNLMINNHFGIYGDNSTSLEINEGTIKKISTETSAGGINVGKNIIINNPTSNYEAIWGINPAIYANDSIIINSGIFKINSGGKIFKSGNSIIINSGTLVLQSRADKGIEAGNSIYINNGIININSLESYYAKNNIYLGIRDDNNSNLKININSLDKGMEAKGIEIY